uniref:Uncharacterized LOC101067466 n=1 Tax=Takifugu rubripes TaxID=31033 RepID=A0A674P830_TAKRU
SEPSECCFGQSPLPPPPSPLEGFCLCCRVRGGSRRGEAGPAEGRGEGDRRRLLSGLQLVAGGTPAHPVPERPPLGGRQTVEAAASFFFLECLIVSISPLQVIETLLFSTFVSWKVFFPLVRDDCNCTYTFITGGAGEKLLMPGTGFLTVGAASALAFCQALREEYPEVPCKLNEVKINTGVDAPERTTPGYLNNLDLGEAVATLVEARNSSHSVFTVSSPADLKTALLERNL